MSFGVTLNTNKNYIDTAAINEVAKQIFTNAQSKTAQTSDLGNIDLTKFRRADVGIDLYSQRTDIDTAKFVAVRNAGLDINLNQNFIANVQYLNTMAALDATKVQKNVEGKMIAPVAEGEKSEVKNIDLDIKETANDKGEEILKNIVSKDLLEVKEHIEEN